MGESEDYLVLNSHHSNQPCGLLPLLATKKIRLRAKRHCGPNVEFPKVTGTQEILALKREKIGDGVPVYFAVPTSGFGPAASRMQWLLDEEIAGGRTTRPLRSLRWRSLRS